MTASGLSPLLLSSFPSVSESSLVAMVELLDAGAAIPWIARYQKARTGGASEDTLRRVRARVREVRDLLERKESILKLLEEKGLLTDLLREEIQQASDRKHLEEIYLPVKPRRKTKASAAREKGLDPLATKLFDQKEAIADLQAEAAPYVSEEQKVVSTDEALKEASYIIADQMNTTPVTRAFLRREIFGKAVIRTAAAPSREGRKSKYMDYYEFSESAATIPSHRILAIRRGEREGFLKVTFEYDRTRALAFLEETFLTVPEGPHREFLKGVILDAFDRLLVPTLEAELRQDLKDRADSDAIHIFCNNFRQLLLTPPSPGHRVAVVDSNYREGILLVFLDGEGKLLAHEQARPKARPEGDPERDRILQLLTTHAVDAIVVGENSTSRDIHVYLRILIRDNATLKVPVLLIDETASKHYSTSDLAKDEFPNLPSEVRKCISLGRRYEDPLYELVKVDPKHIGVGQYQQEVDQEALGKALHEVLESAVNQVGVDLNRASVNLLQYVAGLNEELAHQVVRYRNAHGPFPSRAQLAHVPGFTPAVFEQCSGFLRIKNGTNPLDDTFVHPAHYPVVEAVAKHLDAKVPELLTQPERLEGVDLSQVALDGVSEELIHEVAEELRTPTLDPRADVRVVQFKEEVCEISDLTIGMVLQGKITNVTNFGVFVDIGVHQDGLVHVSELSHGYIKDPTLAVSVGDVLHVKVIGVDRERNRISLSVKAAQDELGAEAMGPARLAKAVERSASSSQGPRKPRGANDRTRGDDTRESRPVSARRQDQERGTPRPVDAEEEARKKAAKKKKSHGGSASQPHKQDALKQDKEKTAEEKPANFQSQEDFIARMRELQKHFKS